MAVDTTVPNREDFEAADPDPIKPIELGPDGLPKRRRGRPPGSKNRPKDGSYSPRSSTGKSLEAQIGGLLFTVNLPLRLIPATQRDALDTVEIAALAKAINEECSRNARFRRYVESALKIQGATSLVSVVGLIAARRVVRHEIFPIPDEMGGSVGVDQQLGSLISVVSGQGAINPNLVVMPKEPAATTEV